MARSHPTDIRRLALVALYQLDAAGEADASAVAEGLAASLEDAAALVDEVDGSRLAADGVTYSAGDRERAAALALAAWSRRDEADADLEALAPDWPPRRQAAIDRAILRLAYYEISAGLAPAGAAINEAVELAKAFSTDRSPRFINGVLGRLVALRA